MHCKFTVVIKIEAIVFNIDLRDPTLAELCTKDISKYV